MTTNISFHWDAENVRPSATDARRSAKLLVKLITEEYERLHPGTRARIEFKVYADCQELPGDLRGAFVDAGADMVHVPGPKSRGLTRNTFRTDEGDRQIMYDMFKFAKEHGPPAVLVLVTGDSDFTLTLRALQEYGFTTISLYNHVRMGVAFKGVADYEYYWNDLNQRNGVLSGPPNQKALKRLVPKERIAKDPNEVLILWDFKTMSPPNHVTYTHADACAHLLQRVTQTLAAGGIAMGMSYLKIFGEKELPAQDSRSNLVAEYVTTTDSNQIKKANHINNEMTSKMMRFFYENNPPATIVVVSTRSELAKTLLSLTNASYNTVVCKRSGYDTESLEDASTLEFQFPW